LLWFIFIFIVYEILLRYYTEEKRGGGTEEVKLSDEAEEKLDYIALLKLVGATVGTREVDQVADKMFKIAKDKY
jgi:hypothetical protein